jgi:enoyl-CoA hydratase/carnithine racemase
MALVEITRAGRIATVTFDRGNKANALSLALMRELTQVARSFEDDFETSAVILRGRADNFCFGFDLRDAETQELHHMPLAQRRVVLETGGRMCKAWEGIAPLTICAIEGWCVGGGVALAVSCDLRIAAQDATFYVPEVARGLNMSWGSVPRITNLVGPARAKRIILLTEKVTAAQAETWGLADQVTAPAAACTAARDWAETAAAMPPAAIRMCKRDINAYANALAGVATHAGVDGFALLQASEDAAEGSAAFIDRRTPKFTGK